MKAKATKNDRAISILRVSSHKQKDNTSHDVQEKEIAAYAEEKSLRIERTARITESAKDADSRKQFSEALGWALSNDVKHVLFYMYDREARNLTDNERHEKLVRAGLIELHYVRERKTIHQESPDSDFFMRDMNAVMNKNFCRVLGAKVSDAFRQKAESGWLPTNKVHLGYRHERLRDESGRERKRGTIIIPDEKTRPQVVREFELRAEGFSYLEIRRRIIAEGFIAASDIRHYHVSMIERRISSPFYRGFFEYKGVEYEGKHERIIPEAILEAVDATLGHRGKGKPSGGIFGGGWLKCTECGCHIAFEEKKKRIKSTGEVRAYRYYHCTNGRRVHVSLRGMNVTEESIWTQFGKALDDISLPGERADEIARIINETHHKVRAQRRREHDDYRMALERLERAEDGIYDDLKRGVLDDEQYRRQIERVREDRRRFTKLLEQCAEELDDAYLETAKSILELAKEARSLWVIQTPLERRKFLELVLSNRTLDGLIVRYELKKPFETIRKIGESDDWRPLVDEFRTNVIALAA